MRRKETLNVSFALPIYISPHDIIGLKGTYSYIFIIVHLNTYLDNYISFLKGLLLLILSRRWESIPISFYHGIIYIYIYDLWKKLCFFLSYPLSYKPKQDLNSSLKMSKLNLSIVYKDGCSIYLLALALYLFLEIFTLMSIFRTYVTTLVFLKRYL